jgi:hypothetical protein
MWFNIGQFDEEDDECGLMKQYFYSYFIFIIYFVIHIK